MIQLRKDLIFVLPITSRTFGYNGRIEKYVAVHNRYNIYHDSKSSCSIKMVIRATYFSPIFCYIRTCFSTQKLKVKPLCLLCPLEVNGIPAFATPDQEKIGLDFNDKKIDLIVELIDRKTKK